MSAIPAFISYLPSIPGDYIIHMILLQISRYCIEMSKPNEIGSGSGHSVTVRTPCGLAALTGPGLAMAVRCRARGPPAQASLRLRPAPCGSSAWKGDAGRGDGGCGPPSFPIEDRWVQERQAKLIHARDAGNGGTYMQVSHIHRKIMKRWESRCKGEVVPRGGLEPPTRGFSVRCSTC